jgi:hypothetical protein
LLVEDTRVLASGTIRVTGIEGSMGRPNTQVARAELLGASGILVVRALLADGERAIQRLILHPGEGSTLVQTVLNVGTRGIRHITARRFGRESTTIVNKVNTNGTHAVVQHGRSDRALAIHRPGETGRLGAIVQRHRTLLANSAGRNMGVLDELVETGALRDVRLLLLTRTVRELVTRVGSGSNSTNHLHTLVAPILKIIMDRLVKRVVAISNSRQRELVVSAFLTDLDIGLRPIPDASLIDIALKQLLVHIRTPFL